jgi:hypothetical protein
MRNDKGLTRTRKSKNDRADDDDVQGEGDYKSARNFNEAEREFVASGKVPSAARAAAPKSDARQRELLAAEREGKRRARK